MANKKSKSKLIWIILAIIVALVAVLSFTDCFNTSTEVDYSEFSSLIIESEGDGIVTKDELSISNATEINRLLSGYQFNAIKIDNVYIDGYVVSFDLINDSVENTLNQFFVGSATEGLKYWENMLLSFPIYFVTFLKMFDTKK